MNFEHYKLYHAEDFVLDENFIKLAKGFHIEEIDLEKFRNGLPEKSNEIALALEIIHGLKTIKRAFPQERKAEIFGLVYQANKPKLYINLLRYAAIAILMFGLGILTQYLLSQKSDIEKFAASNRVETINSELILANGKRIEITNNQSKIEYAANGTSVSLNDSSMVEQSEAFSGESFNQVNVPYGKRSNILLSDGSRVWLNSGSKLIYAPVFKGKSREVYLEGEAYFEVLKDVNKPFFVRTDKFQIKVLGTRFSVQAYNNESEQSAVLVEGKVSLSRKGKFFSQEQVLAPNQKATLSDSKDEFDIADVEDAQDYIDWIHGYLSFQNEDIASLSKRISRYYNIEIEVKATVNSKFSGKLDLKESPDRILDGLATIFNVKYQKQDGKIVFY